MNHASEVDLHAGLESGGGEVLGSHAGVVDEGVQVGRRLEAVAQACPHEVRRSRNRTSVRHVDLDGSTTQGSRR